MEYSSSEDDELVEDKISFEEDIKASDVDQQTEEATESLQIEVHGDSTLASVNNSIDNQLLVVADGDLKNHTPCLGMEFESDASARAFYNSYALRLGFGIRVARSRCERRKGVEVLVMKRFVCLKEGHHKKKITENSSKKKRKRLSIRDGCPAMMEVVRRRPEKWVVTKLVLEHTHIVVSPERVREIQLSRLSGKDREHQDYLKEMRRRVFGEGDAQILIEYFKRMQAENSGFFYAMQVDNRNCITNVLWADTKARMSYGYFGDAVTFDTTYRQNKNMMPFAAFTGLNHHGQTIVFGCALVIDKTESSFAWLFETWLTAMNGRPPLTITTDQGKAMEAAVAKVFPDTRHRLCRWRILSRCKKKLSDANCRYPTLHGELKMCINESVTIETFEVYWRTILDKYNLRDNTWLQTIYSIRHRWVPAYLKGSFFAELTTTLRVESMNRLYRNNFVTESSLEMFIAKIDQEMDSRYEKEAQEDYATLNAQRILKTESPMEKQAANIYTRFAFEKFQVELVEAFNQFPVKIQDGPLSKFSVGRDGDARSRHFVIFNESEKKAYCNCFKYEVSGIPCRHVLGLLLVCGTILLPEYCILKRWTRKAKNGLVLHGSGHEGENYPQDSPILWYNDLLHESMKCAERGASSAEAYKIAKDILRNVFSEIVGFEENGAKSLPQHMEKFQKSSS
ncbi:protein FAR1-RELATED SEQUENCE 5-like [Canna indica]|uniref:Protein FAR1-RELATED SEQUENCE n=1 Tax=Canna indica TaxID=4628 RepID=A0AAQ3Q5U0_9LILI|nr:protein FAR1-RELATED SEQUENCE 5-like [Canna indica]